MVNFEVLDKGIVELIEHMGNDLTVVNSARVSFSNHKENFEDKDEKLIRYLAKHNHWTPFAHPQITLRIKAPISYPTFRKRPDKSMKQGSDGVLECTGEGDTSGGFATHPLYESYNHLMKKAEKVYEDLCASNVAPEQARFCLPQAMYTEWYWTGSLAAYARFYKQRSDDHAQWEIQQYADAIGKIIEPLFPVSWKELTN